MPMGILFWVLLILCIIAFFTGYARRHFSKYSSNTDLACIAWMENLWSSSSVTKEKT